VILLLGIQHAPLVFLAALAALRSLPHEMSEAARVSGAGAGRMLRRIVLPLVAPSLIAAHALTFSNFAEILFHQSMTVRAFLNSTVIAACAAVLLAGVALFVAHYAASRMRQAQHRHWPQRDGGNDLCHSGPGDLGGLHPRQHQALPLLAVSIYNTLWIILLAYPCEFFAILATLVLPVTALFSTALVTTYGVSALRWSSGTETIAKTIFNDEDGGYTTLAAAMGAVTVIATVGLMGALDWRGRRAPPGVVPWRF
jgi:iron(III) transport system permease protein